MPRNDWSDEEIQGLVDHFVNGGDLSTYVNEARGPSGSKSKAIRLGLFFPDPSYSRPDWPERDRNCLLAAMRKHPRWGAATLIKKREVVPPWTTKLYSEDAIAQQKKRMADEEREKAEAESREPEEWAVAPKSSEEDLELVKQLIRENANTMTSKELAGLLEKRNLKRSAGRVRKIISQLCEDDGEFRKEREASKPAPKPKPAAKGTQVRYPEDKIRTLRLFLRSHGPYYKAHEIAAALGKDQPFPLEYIQNTREEMGIRFETNKQKRLAGRAQHPLTPQTPTVPDFGGRASTRYRRLR